MSNDYSVVLGTVSAGIWRSDDGGDSWIRSKGSRPRMPWSELQVFDVVVHPKDSKVIYAGTNEGIYRSDDRGASFERLESEVSNYDVWCIAIDPVEPDTVFAGCRPGALFRSKDAGQHWQLLPAEFAEECANVSVPRVTQMAIDPSDHRIVWAGAEVDGVRRSLDGGDTWTRVDTLEEIDIHAMVFSPGSPSKLIVSTAPEVYFTSDVGESWQTVGAKEKFPMSFCRGVTIKPDDSNVVFLGNGNSFVGDQGAILRSQDRGETWENLTLPDMPNSPIWSFAMNQANPDRILCNSHYGEVYSTEDAGDSWRKLDKEFSEIRALAWTPN